MADSDLFYSVQFQFVPQAVAQISWGRNRLIISQIKSIDGAIWSATAIVEDKLADRLKSI